LYHKLQSTPTNLMFYVIDLPLTNGTRTWTVEEMVWRLRVTGACTPQPEQPRDGTCSQKCAQPVRPDFGGQKFERQQLEQEQPIAG
jgi:hypothetical protein